MPDPIHYTPEQVEQIIRSNKPFRLNNVNEVLLMTELFKRASGLKDPTQFATNCYGLPFLPYPISLGYEGVIHPRLAPPGISREFFGHPLFWIDPELTAPTAIEVQNPTAWSLRIFFLLIEMGLCRSDGRWVNVVSEAKGEYTNEDILSYHRGDKTIFDDIWYTRDDLDPNKTETDRLNEYRAGLEQIIKIQRKARLEFTTAQTEAYDFASNLLLRDDEWSDILQKAQEVSWEVRRRGMEDESISDMVDPVFAIKDRAVDHLTRMSAASVRLAVHGLEMQTFSTKSYSELLTLAEHVDSPEMRKVYDQSLDRVAEGMFSGSGGIEQDTPSRTVFVVVLERLYANVRNRLDLAATNYRLLREGKMELFDTLAEKELSEAADQLGI